MFNKAAVLFTIFCITLAEDYYELLGVSRSADQREIRRAFKKLAVTQHPDKNEDPKAHEKFVRLTTVYEVLKDPDLRKKYDLYGEEGLDDFNKKPSYHSWNYYQNNFGIYDDDPEIVTLNRNDYSESVLNSEKMWIINFYSPMCSHCHHLAPVWRKVAEELDGVIRVGAVNCEDDFQLCHQVGIRAYPTLFYMLKNSKHAKEYTGERTREAIVRFVLDRLDIDVPRISHSTWNFLRQGERIKKPTLVFVESRDDYCFSSDDRLKVAAIFDKTLNIRTFYCERTACNDIFFEDSCAAYLPIKTEGQPWSPVIISHDTESVKELVEKILDQLPEPQELSDQEFEDIRKQLKLKKELETGWLVCFYMGHSTDFDIVLKKLPNTVNNINLGKINCGRHSNLCSALNINRYPMWGVIKPGGAFELSHGKNTIHEIAKFAESSIRAQNVWALSADKVLSILQRTSGEEVWFLDWYAPWCPPCMQFLPEVRKASMQFDMSTVHFGTVDCTAHSTICRQYNIRSYPTAMLINGSKTHQFTLHKTAENIVQFIHDIQHPSVIQLTSNNFHEHLGEKKKKLLWVVDYFVGWCSPCQQLAPEWTTVAKVLHTLPFVRIASVDCETENYLCRSQGVQSYPTIKMYPTESRDLNAAIRYNGPHHALSILKWVSRFLPTKVRDLDRASLQKLVLSGKDVWIVDFFAPWCDHCQRLEPHFAIAAQNFAGKVQFGRFNCDHDPWQCTEAGIRAYPSLIIYSPRNNERDISKGFRISASTSEMIREKVLEFLHSEVKHIRDEL